MLSLVDIKKYVQNGEEAVTAGEGVSLQVNTNELVAVMESRVWTAPVQKYRFLIRTGSKLVNDRHCLTLSLRTLVGAGFGLVSAIKPSKLNPIEVLHSD